MAEFIGSVVFSCGFGYVLCYLGYLYFRSNHVDPKSLEASKEVRDQLWYQSSFFALAANLGWALYSYFQTLSIAGSAGIAAGGFLLVYEFWRRPRRKSI